ncbi:MAG: methyltransferase domain-containing protein [Luteitalea sp.]|nr:methyltransferase domain-containing protein [Luteitalea sp.]
MVEGRDASPRRPLALAGCCSFRAPRVRVEAVSGPSHGVDLSVVIPAFHEGHSLTALLPELSRTLAGLGVTYELLVVTRDLDRSTTTAVERAGARHIVPEQDGYGVALMAGCAEARGEYILTMDADLAPETTFVRTLWAARIGAKVTIASRYVQGGEARVPWRRWLLSRALNLFFRRGLSVPIRDLSSSVRLYDAAILRDLQHDARDLDILPEVIVRAFAEGWVVREVPFTYAPRLDGSSRRGRWRLAGAYLQTFWSLWKHHNSIVAADYDDRAHDSIIWLQRYWQRSRYRHVTDLIAAQGAVLDVGCGSSRIIVTLPPGSVAIDILRRKLRYARRFGRPVVQASGFALPVRDGAFPCVLCSQVIEHVPKESPILDELCRALAPGGRLVIGTPDYANWQWVWMEKAYGLAAPGGYADEHIAHYTYDELMEIFTTRGFRFEEARYILRGELIMAFRKGGAMMVHGRRVRQDCTLHDE